VLYQGNVGKTAPKQFQKPATARAPMQKAPPVASGAANMGVDRKRLAMQKMVQMGSQIKS